MLCGDCGVAECAMNVTASPRPLDSRGSASKSSIRRFVITEKAPTRAFSWLKAATTAFTFKILLRHYAKRTLVGAFFVITNLRMDLFEALVTTDSSICPLTWKLCLVCLCFSSSVARRVWRDRTEKLYSTVSTTRSR